MCVAFTRDVTGDSVIQVELHMNAETRRSSFLMTCLCVKPDKAAAFFSIVLKGTSAERAFHLGHKHV